MTTPSPLDTRAIIDSIREEAVTVLIGAPTFLRPLLQRAEPDDLRSLELVVTGAEKLPDDLRLGFLERFHIRILQGYGLTETSPVSNVNQPDPAVTTATADEQLGNRVGHGRPPPSRDDGARRRPRERALSSRTARRGSSACAARTSSRITSGRIPPAARRSASGWFVTWDLARVDEDGFVSVEGRLARFSKVGGEMVPHGTVEAKIAELFGVDPGEAQSVVVVGVPDAAKGEALVALCDDRPSCGRGSPASFRRRGSPTSGFRG